MEALNDLQKLLKSDNKSQIFSDLDSIQQFILALEQKYQLAMQTFKADRIKLQESSQQQKILKNQLAKEIKNHEETVLMAQQELQKLIQFNDKLKEQDQTSIFLEQQQKLKDDIEKLNDQILNYTKQISWNNNEIQKWKESGQSLQSQLQLNKQTLIQQKENEKTLQNLLTQESIQLNQFKKDYKSLLEKCQFVDEKFNLINGQKIQKQSDIQRKLLEFKYSKQKIENLQVQLSEQETIKQHIINEIHLKDNQLTHVRSANKFLQNQIDNQTKSEISNQKIDNARKKLLFQYLKQQIKSQTLNFISNEHNEVTCQFNNIYEYINPEIDEYKQQVVDKNGILDRQNKTIEEKEKELNMFKEKYQEIENEQFQIDLKYQDLLNMYSKFNPMNEIQDSKITNNEQEIINISDSFLLQQENSINEDIQEIKQRITQLSTLNH